MKKIIKLLAPAYLGVALSAFANIHFTDWRFYAILGPFYLLAILTDFNKSTDAPTSELSADDEAQDYDVFGNDKI